MSKNYYLSGENNLICDSCGKKIKLHEARVRWDGLVVCQADYEERQPQDFVRARQDKITVPLVRPRPTDLFVDGVNCDAYTHSPVAGVGTADCAQVDYPGTYFCATYYIDNVSTAYVGTATVGVAIVGEEISPYTVSVCARSPQDLRNLLISIAGVAIASGAVAGTPYTMPSTL